MLQNICIDKAKGINTFSRSKFSQVAQYPDSVFNFLRAQMKQKTYISMLNQDIELGKGKELI